MYGYLVEVPFLFALRVASSNATLGLVPDGAGVN